MEIKTPIEWNDFAEDFLDADGNIFRADQIATALNLATDREKRLVEALEHYADICDLCLHKKSEHFGEKGMPDYCCDGCDEFQNVAAEALAEHKGEK